MIVVIHRQVIFSIAKVVQSCDTDKNISLPCLRLIDLRTFLHATMEGKLLKQVVCIIK